MDEKSFDIWSDTLAEIRLNRKHTIESEAKQKAGSFGPNNFYEIAMNSLDEAVMKWWNIEQKSWEESPPAKVEDALESARSEMENLIEFELESIEADFADIQDHYTWDPKTVKVEKQSLENFSEELRKNYRIKVDSLTGRKSKKDGGKEESEQKGTQPRAQQGATTQGASGFSVFFMFVFGLALGLGAAYYYHSEAKKAALAYEAQHDEIRNEKRALETSLNLIQESFTKLAYGRIRNIPEIKRSMDPIVARANRDRKAVERDFNKKREGLLRRVPAGDRQDRSLLLLEEEKEKKLQAVNNREQSRLAPHMKEYNALKEMLGE